ncbi:MAG: extracellular solute-binding protein [Alphaproteobacteria bacterium]
MSIKINKRFLLLLPLITIIPIITILLSSRKEYVHIYNWYGVISKDVIRQFEKETGIYVRLDMIDSNTALEAKLLASHSGYDVVFPSVGSFVERHIKAGLYQPLNKKFLPNLKNIDSFFIEKMESIDPGMTFAIPYYWGTYGILLDLDCVKKCLGEGYTADNYDVIFNPSITRKLSKYGISLLEEPADVFPVLLVHLGHDLKNYNEEVLNKAFEHLKKIRPFLRSFAASQIANDIMMGNVCVAQALSSDALKIVAEAKEIGKNIIYTVPKKSMMWLDCATIPRDAPHPKNAHIFLNFILKPEIAAMISNATCTSTVINKSYDFALPHIRDNPHIYPSSSIKKQLFLEPPSNTEVLMQLIKKRMYFWSYIRQMKGKQ